jgi:hypothetical protein
LNKEALAFDAATALGHVLEASTAVQATPPVDKAVASQARITTEEVGDESVLPFERWG